MAQFIDSLASKRSPAMRKAPLKKPKKARASQPDTSNLDLDPDAWPKFEKLVKSAAKLGPKPHGAPANRKK